MQVNRQKTTVKKKITYFFKNCVTSLFTFFEKVFDSCKFFTAVFRCKVLRTVFYSFEVQSTVLVASEFPGRKNVDLVLTFNKEREETFTVSLQNRKSCVCLKYLTLVGSTTKVNCHEFYFFILDVKCM